MKNKKYLPIIIIALFIVTIFSTNIIAAEY